MFRYAWVGQGRMRRAQTPRAFPQEYKKSLCSLSSPKPLAPKLYHDLCGITPGNGGSEDGSKGNATGPGHSEVGGLGGGLAVRAGP